MVQFYYRFGHNFDWCSDTRYFAVCKLFMVCICELQIIYFLFVVDKRPND